MGFSQTQICFTSDHISCMFGRTFWQHLVFMRLVHSCLVYPTLTDQSCGLSICGNVIRFGVATCRHAQIFQCFFLLARFYLPLFWVRRFFFCRVIFFVEIHFSCASNKIQSISHGNFFPDEIECIGCSEYGEFKKRTKENQNAWWLNKRKLRSGMGCIQAVYLDSTSAFFRISHFEHSVRLFDIFSSDSSISCQYDLFCISFYWFCGKKLRERKRERTTALNSCAV